MGLIKIDSDGKLKPLSDYVWKGRAILSRVFERGNASYDDLLNGSNPFKVQEYMLAPVGQNSEVFPFAEREMSIAAGPLFGQSGAVKERDDAALRLYGGNMVLFKSSGSTLQEYASVSATGTSALIAGDFAGEGVELGTPVRVVNRNDRSYTAVLQGIPYHVDTIAPDGKSVTAEPVNFSYTKGSKAEYSASSSESENNNTKFNMTSSLETIFAMDSDITRNIAGGMASLPSIERTIKFPTNKKPGTLDYITSIKNTAGMVFNFLNKLPDKVESVEEVYDNELEETNVFKSIYSDRFDVVSYVYANQYIWRYPIITNPALAYFGTAEKDAKYLTKQDFVTFAIYDDTNSDNFTSDSSYQPTHENGNLFSYPAAVPNIEGYNERQKDLTEITGVQFGIPTSLGFTKIRANEHEETSSTTVTKGYLTKAISLLDSIFNTSLANVPEAKPDSAFTKKTSNQEKFILTLPNADGARLLGSYRIQTQAYIAEDGALICGFAVNQFDQYASLFNSGSLYRQLPDPSFVLPRKFVLINSTPFIPEFGANTERETAMEMRGVRFYAVDFNVYSTNRLLEGVKYRVEVPLYNASFQTASNVKVNLYWVNDRTEASLADKHLIATTSMNMTGWSDTGDNKAWAMFEFTPSDMAEYGRHYQLYAVIDPDDSMQEVHEKRDLAKDSGGNNEGYFEFSVESVESSNALQDGLNVNDNNIELPDITYSGYASWEEFYV